MQFYIVILAKLRKQQQSEMTCFWKQEPEKIIINSNGKILLTNKKKSILHTDTALQGEEELLIYFL